jgi:hypothetical protein
LATANVAIVAWRKKEKHFFPGKFHRKNGTKKLLEQQYLKKLDWSCQKKNRKEFSYSVVKMQGLQNYPNCQKIIKRFQDAKSSQKTKKYVCQKECVPDDGDFTADECNVFFLEEVFDFRGWQNTFGNLLQN